MCSKRSEPVGELLVGAERSRSTRWSTAITISSATSRSGASDRRDPRRGILGRDEDAEGQPATAATFAAWIALLRAGAPRERQRGLGAAVAQRLEVGAVLAQDRRGARAVDRAAVAGDDVRGLLDDRLEPRRASRGRRSASRRRRSSGSRPARGSRRATSTLAHGTQTAIPSAVWPSVACSSSSCSPRSQRPGTGQHLRARQAERARAAPCSSPRRSRAACAGRRRARCAAAARSTPPRPAAPRGTRSGRAGGPSRRAWRAARRRGRPPARRPPAGSRARRGGRASRRRTPPRPSGPACRSSARSAT